MNGSQKTWLCLIDQPGAVRAERHRTAVGQRGPRVRRLCLQHVPVDDTILYALLTLYLDKLGVSLALWSTRQSRVPVSAIVLVSAPRWSGRGSGAAARVDGAQQPSISIRELTKYFTSLILVEGGAGGVLPAGRGVLYKGEVFKDMYNGISMDMYKGEMFCLLGHNGAGKAARHHVWRCLDPGRVCEPHPQVSKCIN